MPERTSIRKPFQLLLIVRFKVPNYFNDVPYRAIETSLLAQTLVHQHSGSSGLVCVQFRKWAPVEIIAPTEPTKLSCTIKFVLFLCSILSLQICVFCFSFATGIFLFVLC